MQRRVDRGQGPVGLRRKEDPAVMGITLRELQKVGDVGSYLSPRLGIPAGLDGFG